MDFFGEEKRFEEDESLVDGELQAWIPEETTCAVCGKEGKWRVTQQGQCAYWLCEECFQKQK